MGTGSGSNTSKPAPAIVPLVSACCRASVSTTGPRDRLTRIDDGFIILSCFSPMKWFVCGVRGTCMERKSDSAKTLLNEAYLRPYSFSRPRFRVREW